MHELTPGTRVLYRDGDRYILARIDLVRAGYYTAFPFDPVHRRWGRARRRIARSFIVAPVPPAVEDRAIAARINALTNERNARRAAANSWLESRLTELLQQEEPA